MQEQNLSLNLGFIVRQQFSDEDWRFIARHARAIPLQEGDLWYIHITTSSTKERLHKQRAIEFLQEYQIRGRFIQPDSISYLISCPYQPKEGGRERVDKIVMIHTPGEPFQSFFFALD